MKSKSVLSKIFGMFSIAKKEKKKNSASLARIRLEAVLSKDKINRDINFLPKMEEEIIAVLSKYMDISNDDITCDLREKDGEEVLDLSVNFHRKFTS